MTSSPLDPRSLPFLGAGLGYRGAIAEAMLESREAIDCVELLTDQYLERADGLDQVRRVCEAFRVTVHGIGLSVGSATGLDREYLSKIKRVSDIANASYYSEHLCMTRAPGISIGHLAPLQFTEDVLKRTIRNVRFAQEFLERPLALENVTYTIAMPRSEMSQPEFFQRLVDATGCGVLLDVTNVYINSCNHHFDPREFLAGMPLHQVMHIHLAGGYWSDGVLVDSHSRPVHEESWELLEAVIGETAVRACIIEHDQDFPDRLDFLLEQVARARAIMAGARSAATV
jgi:uncharacterized protein